jgi:hypothetical protein
MTSPRHEGMARDCGSGPGKGTITVISSMQEVFDE